MLEARLNLPQPGDEKPLDDPDGRRIEILKARLRWWRTLSRYLLASTFVIGFAAVFAVAVDESVPAPSGSLFPLVPLFFGWLTAASVAGYLLALLVYVGLVAFGFAKVSLGQCMAVVLAAGLCVALMQSLPLDYQVWPAAALLFLVFGSLIYLHRQDPLGEGWLPEFIRKARGDRVRAKIRQRREGGGA